MRSLGLQWIWDEANLGDAAAEGLGPLAAAKVNQVEATAATKEGGGGRGGRVEAEKIGKS